MYIKKTVLYATCLTFLSFWSVSVLSQPIVHHELMVKLIPENSQIQVVDKIDLSTLYEKALSGTTSQAFLIHEGNGIRVVEKNVRIKKESLAYAQKHFPLLIRDQLKVGNVPVDVYSVALAQGQQQLTLEYTRKIYHAIETGGEETARSISQSSGLITSQGTFLAKESFWFPVFGDELLTFNLSVRVPLKWKAVSQGERIYSEDNGVMHMDTWRETRAQDDIYLVAAEFIEYEQAAGSVKAMAFLRTADDGLAQKYLDTTAQYLEMYRNLLGPYPYSKFALVENFWETGFGMPSFTLLGSQIIRFPFILHSSYPHELLHNWWGNSVYVDYKTGNWAEGLTSYLADHLVKEQREKGQDYRRSALQKYTNFANPENDFPLAEFISRFDEASSAIGYGKTLMLFHMLRMKLGDEVFLQGLRALYREYRYKTAGYKEVETVFSDVSGVNLSGFFTQWVARRGAPSLALKQAEIDTLPSGKYRLNIEIEQIQAAAVYQLEVPLVISFENQKDAERLVFSMSNKTEKLTFDFDVKPSRLDIDPEFDLFRRLDINETPPAISSIFGAKQSLIILPANAPLKKLAAYEKLAQHWLRTQKSNISIEYDKNLNALPQNTSLWILGWENKFKADVISALRDYDIKVNGSGIRLSEHTLQSDENSLILIGRNPKKIDDTLALISADNAEAIPGLGRKLPHYGRYSYLAFEGTEPTNHVKGQWPAVNSPLSFQFENGAKLGEMDKRVALATMSPIFSEKRLMAHVTYLASEALAGRGLGSSGIDKAAEYIAAEFRSAGLQPLLGKDQFFQQWQQTLVGEKKAIDLKNVIAYLPGNNPKYAGQSIIVSAHYDHLGLGERAVRKGNEGKIHFGADDNASGVSVLLELGRLLAKQGGLPRSVIFVAFTGEEADRLGSRYFVKNVPHFLAKNIFAAVNLDAVGRLNDNPLIVFGADSASEWVHVFRGVGFVTGIKIKPVSNDVSGSDHQSFHGINIPAVQFFSGVNEDFHRPSDTVDKIDSAGLVKVAVALKETVSYLSEREPPLTNQLKPNGVMQRPTSGRRVSLGTVPDFSYEGNGVLISSVVPNSPAAKAKIQGKDILVGMNGREVKNLRVFSKILRGLKPGDQVRIKLRRDGKDIEVTTRLIAR